MKKFQKGNPGGPGRPRGSSRNIRCATWADKKGFDFLERVAEGREPGHWSGKVRAEVAMYLIDRGYGKPTQSMDVGSNGEGLFDFLGGEGK